MEKMYSKLRKFFIGSFWTKDKLQDKLYRMGESKLSPTLQNRSEYEKLKDEIKYQLKNQQFIENRKIKQIPQLNSLTELTGGTIKKINDYFAEKEWNKEKAKSNTLHYLI